MPKLSKDILKNMLKYREKKDKQSQGGITLVALAITVIIIIILATVAINFVFGENGLINRAEQAKLEHEIEIARETLTMVLGDAFIEKKINPEYDPNGFLDDFIKEREPNVYLSENAIGLDGHIFDLDRSVPELGEYQGEQTGPRIQAINVLEETTSSATIEVVTENAEGATYTYSYKIDGTEEWIEVETEDENSNICTIEGLTQGEIYNIKVVVTTDTGTVEQEVNVYLGKIPEGTITFTPAEWVGDGTATTTINTTAEGFTLQYQVQSADGTITQWTNITSGNPITGLEHGDTVYGRLFDGTNASKTEGTTTVQDEVPPSAPLIITSGAVGNNEYYKSDATVTITGGNDGESGANKVRYVVTGAQTIAQTDTADGTTSTNVTISADGESTITAYTIDKAGNVSAARTGTINKDSTLPSTASLTVGTVGETSIAVTASGADATSGIYSYEFQISTTSATTGFTTPEGGTHTSSATSYSYTYSNLSDDTTYYLRVVVTDRAGNTRTSTAVTQKTEAAGIPETTSYVGYYADVDGNGSVDGIIYADLAFSKSGTWGTSSGTYSYTKKSNLKKYKVEGTHTENGFGLKGIVKPNGGSGNERFYVMALSDVDNKQNGTYYCWYDAAYGNMSDYATYTSVNFGTGEQNTSKMITKWNGSGYGAQNDNSSYDDMWGISAVQSGTWNGSSGWYVPSKQEWAAFGDAFSSITSSNYSSTFGLSSAYWSSSQISTYNAGNALFSFGCLNYGGVNLTNYVRLGTTF